MTNEAKSEIIRKFAEWLLIPDEDRREQGLPLNQTQFAIHHGVGTATLSIWKRELRLKAGNPEEQDTILFLAQLAEDARKVNAPAGIRELYARLKGIYVDKREVKQTVEFTPTDYTRMAQTIIKRLRESYQGGGGSCPICLRPPILLNEVCDNSGQEHSEDGEVATVAVSVRPADPVSTIS